MYTNKKILFHNGPQQVTNTATAITATATARHHASAIKSSNLIRQSEEIRYDNNNNNNISNDDELPVFKRYADIHDPYLKTDLPVFWHVPKVRVPTKK